MKRNKFILFIAVLISTVVGFFFTTNIVNAESYNGQIKSGPYVGGPYYIMHQRGNNKFWLTGQFIIRTSDGHFVYCVQPMVKINSDSTYDVRTEDIQAVRNMSEEAWEKITKIAYYGYGYKDATHNHTDDKYYLATQMLIWKEADKTVDSYFTNTLNGTRNDNILVEQMNSVMDLVNKHDIKPSIQNIPSKMYIGQTVTLTDSNNVLDYYNITNIENAEIVKSGNTLTLKAINTGDVSFKLVKNFDKYSNRVEFYYASDSQNVMRRGNMDPISFRTNISVDGGSVIIKKTDSETYNQVAQGDASLEGAVYGLYTENGNQITTLTTDQYGISKSGKILSLGRYYLQEIKSSKGYLIDNTKYYFEITENNINQEVIVYENVIKNYISILKQYDYVNGTTQFLNAESNIQFQIFDSKGILYNTITTDKNGYAAINLPYGVYKFHQVNSNTGFEKIYDFYVSVDENSQKEQYYNILNNKLSAYLRAIKIDSETGKVIKLANATFKIFNKDTNQYVSQFVGGKVLTEFKTDTYGEFTTYLKLESGNYKLIEVESPKGYLLEKNGVDFTIGDNSKFDYTTYGPYITVYFKNNPIKGKIEIVKQGEIPIVDNGTFSYTNKYLQGVEYGLYANEDIKSSDGNHLYYNKGQLIEKLITDKDGYSISKELPLGKYYLKELRTNDGYVLNELKLYFELTEKDNDTRVVIESLKDNNQIFKGTLEFTKTDLIDGKLIPNVLVEVYTENNNLIYSGKTDVNGKVIIKNLFVGKFYIIEKEPATGYILNEEKVLFEIKSNGEIVKANMTNEKITGTLEFIKKDFFTDKALPNTKIEIYNEKDELVFEGVTDENGKLIIKNLEYGKYYIIEKEAPEGYLINSERMYFEIQKNGEVVKSTMKDESIIISDIPNTEKNEFPFGQLIVLLITGLGAGLCIYANKNKEK